MNTPPDLRLYLVTDRPACLGRPLQDIVAAAVAGGASAVQLREKKASTREFVQLARALKKLLDPHKVPLIINDRIDVALAAKAHGVHVGQDDMHPADVRALIGPHMLLGLSVTGEAELLAARDAPVDYLGFGPIHDTPTKTDAGQAQGLGGVELAKTMARAPFVAIGGVNAANCADIIRAGAHGVAVVSAICSAKDPRRAAEELRREIEKGGK